MTTEATDPMNERWKRYRSPSHDELIDPEGMPREAARAVAEYLDALADDELPLAPIDRAKPEDADVARVDRCRRVLAVDQCRDVNPGLGKVRHPLPRHARLGPTRGGAGMTDQKGSQRRRRCRWNHVSGSLSSKFGGRDVFS